MHVVEFARHVSVRRNRERNRLAIGFHYLPMQIKPARLGVDFNGDPVIGSGLNHRHDIQLNRVVFID